MQLILSLRLLNRHKLDCFLVCFAVDRVVLAAGAFVLIYISLLDK